MNEIIFTFLAFLFLFQANTKTTGHPLIIYYNIPNQSDTPIRVYKFLSPLEEIDYKKFIKVKFEGKELSYTGLFMHGVRSSPRPKIYEESWALINPGETFRVSFDIAKYFDFTRKGSYEIGINHFYAYSVQREFYKDNLHIERCRDLKKEAEKRKIRELKEHICGIKEEVEDLEVSQEEFQRNFIDIRRPSISVTPYLSLCPEDPEDDGLKNKTRKFKNQVPRLGYPSLMASMHVGIFTDNCHHGPGLEEDYDEEKNLLAERDKKEMEEWEKYEKEFEEKICPGISLYKIKKAIKHEIWKVTVKIEHVLNPLIALFHRYIM